MMKTIRIYGASDDLIEVDGDIRDEGGGPGFVELSTGDVFRVDYEDSGCWNVYHHTEPGPLTRLESVEIVRKDAEDEDGYTGHATVTGPIEWVDFWHEWPPSHQQLEDRVEDELRNVTTATLRRCYAEIRGRS